MKPYGIDLCIIEDDPSQRAYLLKRFKGHYSIVEATDGVSGLALVREYRPRVIICDIMMPGISGLDVCRNVRADSALGGTYFIVVTSQPDRATKHLALDVGADDYLTKPYDFEELGARVRNGLRISRLQERLHYAALRDGLTGLWNHTHFRHLLDVEFSRTRRYGGALALLMLDLDHFKAVNDTYGHEAGNYVLVSTAKHISRIVRDTDVVARYGGEEFSIICPRTTLDEATFLAERILQSLPEEVSVPNHPETVITASLGVSSTELAHVNCVSDLINLSDDALYTSKRHGRNRVARADQITMSESEGIDTEQVSRLSRQVASLSMQAKDLCLQSVWALVQALEARDPYTARHSINTTFYADQMAKYAGWNEGLRTTVTNAAMLHDLGKIGVSDRILQKPEPLNEKERSVLRSVPMITCKILEPLRVFETEIVIIRHLREWFDGSGYEAGLVGTSIPIGSRLLAVAEAFDSLTSVRCYRPNRSIEDALEIINDSAGTQFDPEFCELLTQIVERSGDVWSKRIEATLNELNSLQGEYEFPA